jgi:topoisomerase-4 subunit B
MSQEKKGYDESSIVTLEWQEHIRRRPGMYIGKLGDGTAHDDGIYILLKEVADNCIDEFTMGAGNKIEVVFNPTGSVSVRDYGRGIPLGKVVDCASKINTGAKYDSSSFQKSVGLNGVGIKAVNALSSSFVISSHRDGRVKTASFSKGLLVSEEPEKKTQEPNGTKIEFLPDVEVFKGFEWQMSYVESMMSHYSYLNVGLLLRLSDQNGLVKEYKSTRGLLDLLESNLERGGALEKMSYPIIHIKGEDIEIAMTHGDSSGEEIHSFVNGQNTHQGGTHVAAFREAVVKVLREFYQKEYDASGIRSGIITAVSIRVQEPVFESQTKTKLGSTAISPGGTTLRTFVQDFLKRELDNLLHRSSAVAEALQKKILTNERERKELAGIKDVARDRAKKASLRNSKLRDCVMHYNTGNPRRQETTIFITEGDSASGSISASRNVETQAVFSLRGKPLNTHGMTKRVVYENEEFYLLQSALNIEEGISGLRYNNIVMATDADVDGMHIRLLLTTFFLQFFPEVVKEGHLYILQTPLFRVRNRHETAYCYTPEEKSAAIARLGPKPEITRFKGLGEISPDEFGEFIGSDIRLDPVLVGKETKIKDMLSYFMGSNTPDRQAFIIENLRVEEPLSE